MTLPFLTFVLELLGSFDVFWRWGGLWYGDVVILSNHEGEESLKKTFIIVDVFT